MTITVAGRRYRWVGRRRKQQQETVVAAATPHCPYCGGDHLHGAGETVVGPRVTRKPMVCRECGADVVVWWRTSPAMRDRYRDAVLPLNRREEGPRGA